MIRRPTRRKSSGAITALAAALAMTLVVLVMGFFFFTLYMSAQKETKNAIDAGTLNVGLGALKDPSVPIPPTDRFFDITTDKVAGGIDGCDGSLNLRRVNRMWAEAMLFKVNAMSAQAEGTSAEGTQNAETAQGRCIDLSNQLAAKLNDENQLHDKFTDLSNKNTVHMIGIGAVTKVIPGSGWQTAHMMKKKESNVMMASSGGDFFDPVGFNWNTKNTQGKSRTNAKGADDAQFLNGYEPIKIGNLTYWQVPFLYDEKPHMVSKTDFEAEKSDPSGWSNAVPNSFSAEGKATQPGKPEEKAMSWMLTNPRQTFKASIPTGYIKIHIKDPVAHWKFFPHAPGPLIEVEKTTYGFGLPDFMKSVTQGGVGIFCSSSTARATLGTETAGRSVDGALFDLPGSNSDYQELEQNLTARCNQMISKPGVVISTSAMHSALSDNSARAALALGSRDFFVYSPDGQSIACRFDKDPRILKEAPWLPVAIAAGADADGSQKTYGEESQIIGPVFGDASPDPTFTVIIPPFPEGPCGIVEVYMKNFWKSGTGYTHCLGEITNERWTEVDCYTTAVETLI